MWYLEVYFYQQSKTIPAATYGPATIAKVSTLLGKITGDYQRYEIVSKPYGKNPIPEEQWPIFHEMETT